MSLRTKFFGKRHKYDVLDLCVYCGKSTGFGSGRFVGCIPAEVSTESADWIDPDIRNNYKNIEGYACLSCVGYEVEPSYIGTIVDGRGSYIVSIIHDEEGGEDFYGPFTQDEATKFAKAREAEIPPPVRIRLHVCDC